MRLDDDIKRLPDGTIDGEHYAKLRWIEFEARRKSLETLIAACKTLFRGVSTDGGAALSSLSTAEHNAGSETVRSEKKTRMPSDGTIDAAHDAYDMRLRSRLLKQYARFELDSQRTVREALEAASRAAFQSVKAGVEGSAAGSAEPASRAPVEPGDGEGFDAAAQEKRRSR